MKRGGSTLNPNAAPFVPFYKREGAHREQHEMENSHGPQMSEPKRSSETQSTSDEDLQKDMNLEILLLKFPDLSHESINAAYLANNFDLFETIEMLDDLEESIPDTFDIGYAPETIEPTTAAASIQNSASNEESAPSSSSSSSVSSS